MEIKGHIRIIYICNYLKVGTEFYSVPLLFTYNVNKVIKVFVS